MGIYTLNRVARLTSAEHGGQVLISAAVAELVREHLPDDVELQDLGQHHLKGLSQSTCTETSYIYIPGGINDSVICVPLGVGIRVQVHGRVYHLLCDEQHFDATGGDLQIENFDFKNTNSQYHIYIAGDTNHLVIEQQTL